MTIKDIARVCGVSISTVSRVLNERPDVSGEVRCRVLEAVEKYGAVKGGWLALRRVLRCHPFHRQRSVQYDPVP